MRPPMLVFKTPKQIRTVMHPLRMEIIECLQGEGADSIAGLAAKLDRPANALTYHVRLLERAGAIVERGSRRAGRRSEAVYDAASPRIAIGANPRFPAAIRASAFASTAVCRMADREIRHALSSGLVQRGAPLGRRYKTWLTEEDAAAVHKKLQAIERLLSAAHRRKKGRPYAFTSFLVPLEMERKA